MLDVLNDVERDCLDRYLDVLAERLGDDLLEAHVFGSVARGEAWWPGMPIRSDLDLAVRTRRALAEQEKDELFDATYPLFLECGRQISPAFVTELKEHMVGVRVWPR